MWLVFQVYKKVGLNIKVQEDVRDFRNMMSQFLGLYYGGIEYFMWVGYKKRIRRKNRLGQEGVMVLIVKLR